MLPPDDAQGLKLVTVNEIAELLKLKPEIVYKLARENKLPGVVSIGRTRRFNLKVITTWLESGADKPYELHVEPAKAADKPKS